MRSSRQLSFLTGPNKLVLVRMNESTFTGLVGPPYPDYSLYCFVLFCALLHPQKHSQAKIN